ncbi:MAG: PfkB family carbohydrate kinase [Gammaproteobacteria bacterium]
MSNDRITIFGEVLFDRFPDGSRVLGGAPFNVAWHLQAFAAQSLFISRVGSDVSGDAVRTTMQSWRMDLTGLQQDELHPTGSVEVGIEHGEPTYAIVPEQAYDYISAEQLPEDHSKGILYHGTLALRTRCSASALGALKSKHSGIVFMDANLRAPWWRQDDVLTMIAAADWVKLNRHELAALYPTSGVIESDMRKFKAQHDLAGLVVTLGEQGALALNESDEMVTVAPSKALHVVDTVGAGDAFASVLLLGIHSAWPLQTTLERAQQFASSLVEQRGATVHNRDFYRPYVEAWHLD